MSNIPKNSKRYWQQTEHGIKRIIVLEGEQPPEGYQRGLGPTNNAHMSELLSRLHKGRAVTPKQRELMRQAKLGVKKDLAHREAMSKAQKERSNQIHAIMREQNVRWSEACRILKELKGAK